MLNAADATVFNALEGTDPSFDDGAKWPHSASHLVHVSLLSRSASPSSALSAQALVEMSGKLPL